MNESNMTIMDWQAAQATRANRAGRSEQATCTPEERAYLDAIKDGKSDTDAKAAANLAWARRNMPLLDEVRKAHAVAEAARAVTEKHWSALALPFKTYNCWNQSISKIYDYCHGATESLEP